MSTATLSWAGGSVVGFLTVESYASTPIRPPVNTHQLLGGGAAFTTTAGAPSTRPLKVVDLAESDAAALYAALVAGLQITIVPDDGPPLPSLVMPFGTPRNYLEPATASSWIVECEVIA